MGHVRRTGQEVAPRARVGGRYLPALVAVANTARNGARTVCLARERSRCPKEASPEFSQRPCFRQRMCQAKRTEKRTGGAGEICFLFLRRPLAVCGDGPRRRADWKRGGLSLLCFFGCFARWNTFRRGLSAPRDVSVSFIENAPRGELITTSERAWGQGRRGLSGYSWTAHKQLRAPRLVAQTAGPDGKGCVAQRG